MVNILKKERRINDEGKQKRNEKWEEKKIVKFERSEGNLKLYKKLTSKYSLSLFSIQCHQHIS